MKGCFYYFSPTGGTRRVGEIFCDALFEEYQSIDLLKEFAQPGEAEVVVFAAPVFGGRIPAAAAERMRQVEGAGKRCINLAVYGNRHYDDAVLEMNLLAKEQGFGVIAAAAPIAQHSIVPTAAAGRPDAADTAGLQAFAAQVAAKLQAGDTSEPQVPGNLPLKDLMKASATPVSEAGCIACGACKRICPMGAIALENKQVITDGGKCCMCLACTAVCPKKVRKLPDALTAAMTERLHNAVVTRRENEYFI